MTKKGKIKKKETFCSITEIKKRYLPRSFEKKLSEESENARELGIIWAKESIDKIKAQLND